MEVKKSYCRLDWEQWFSLASEYYRSYGNLLVEESYITAGGYRLGRWIERQRAMYNGVIRSTLTEERIEALESIKMVWKLEYRSPWDCWMKEVKKYYEDHGNLAVPRSYKSGIFWLGNWVDEQRKRYSKGALSEEKIKALESCGMVWYEVRQRRWEEWYEDAADYYRSHGNLAVPLSYRTSEGRLLGRWLAVQRERISGDYNRSRLTAKQVAMLNEIGMVWDLQKMRENAWESMYASVSEYLKIHGKLPLWPRNLVSEDGRNIPNWIAVQRTNLSENKCSEEKARRLSQIGIYPWKTEKPEAETAEIDEPESKTSCGQSMKIKQAVRAVSYI